MLANELNHFAGNIHSFRFWHARENTIAWVVSAVHHVEMWNSVSLKDSAPLAIHQPRLARFD